MDSSRSRWNLYYDIGRRGKNVNAVTTELFSSLNSWDFVEDIDHSLAVEKFVATPGNKMGFTRESQREALIQD